MPIYPYTFQLPPLNVQDIPNDGVAGEFLGINGSGVLDWLPVASGGGDMLKSENLSGLADYAIARTNIGLGTASTPTFANLTLTSPSLVSSAPVTISQTWGNNLATFKALVVNAAGTSGTNSASASLLLDLQVGGVSKFNVQKDGHIYVNNSPGRLDFFINNANSLTVFSSQVRCYMPLVLSNDGAFNDTFLLRDGVGTLALRNGANAQTFNVYGTWSSITDYRRLSISCDQTTGLATIATNKGSGTTTGNTDLKLEASSTSYLQIRSSARMLQVAGGVNVFYPTGNNFIISSREAIGGSTNTGMGFQVFEVLGTGTQNTALGIGSLGGTSIGSNNVALGAQSGRFITGGSTNNLLSENSVFLGTSTKAAASGETNQIVIGYDATGIGSNSVVLGNDSITKTALKGNVGIGTTSPSSRLEVAFPTSLTGLNLVSGGSTSVSNFVTWSTPWGTLSGGIKSGPDNGWTTQIFSNQQLSLSAGGVDSSDLLISAAGNVGIGTNAPSSKLHVAGDVTLPNGGSIFFGGGFNIYGTTSATTINGPTAFGQVAVGVNGATKWVFNYDGLFCGGGTTAAFPALKRSSTTIQARLADDTAFAPIQGKLTTDTAFTATTVTPTGFITLYDSTGAAYKVPCVPA